MAKIDWYQATVPHPPLWLIDSLRDRLPNVDLVSMEKPSNPRYERSEALFRDGHKVAEVMTAERYEHPHLLATGSDSHEVAECLRGFAPVHYVTRMDAADDILEPGFYDSAVPLLSKLAELHRVKLECGGDWVRDKMPGRTLYLGSKKSVWRGVLYDKTEERRRSAGANTALRDLVPDNWTRFEARAHPKGLHARTDVARTSADDLIGGSAIGVAIARDLLSRDVARLPIGTVFRQTDLDRAEWWMVSQYEKHIGQRMEMLGGDGELYAAHILRLLQQVRSARS